MAIFNRVAIDNWQRDEVVQKFPKGGLGDIKLGSQCIVNPYETAVFVRSGEAMGTFAPGRHTLETQSIPILSDIIEKRLFGGNVFTADVYYVKISDITIPWGTTQPIIVEHPQRGPGATAIIGNGTFVIKVNDAWRFLDAMDAFRDSVKQADLKRRLDPKLGIMLQDKMSELAIEQNLGPAQLQSFTQELNTLLMKLLQTEFDELGMQLVDFNVRFNMHPQSLKVVTDMGYGTSYTEKQMADAALAAADNPGGGNMADVGLGMMGMSAMMQQLKQDQAAPPAPPAPPAAPEAAPASSSAIPDVLTPRQAAALLQVSEEDVLAAVESGDLKAKKLGNAVRISRTAIEEFLNG